MEIGHAKVRYGRSIAIGGLELTMFKCPAVGEVYGDAGRMSLIAMDNLVDCAVEIS